MKPPSLGPSLRLSRRAIFYKGLKPVHWCISCQTALAEAEVEYENHTSPSIFVKFPVVSDLSFLDPGLAGKKVCRHHLDHDAVDSAGQPGRRIQLSFGILRSGSAQKKSTLCLAT